VLRSVSLQHLVRKQTCNPEDDGNEDRSENLGKASDYGYILHTYMRLAVTALRARRPKGPPDRPRRFFCPPGTSNKSAFRKT